MAIEISVDTNFDRVAGGVNAALAQIIAEQQPILIAAASGVLAQVSYRIHTEGKRSNGSDIGSYSNSYMRTRVKNNRGSDRRVILSLTRQMENDFTVVSQGEATGLGFNNRTNFEKATYMEARYPGTYDLSDDEEQTIVLVLNDYIDGIFE